MVKKQGHMKCPNSRDGVHRWEKRGRKRYICIQCEVDVAVDSLGRVRAVGLREVVSKKKIATVRRLMSEGHTLEEIAFSAPAGMKGAIAYLRPRSIWR